MYRGVVLAKLGRFDEAIKVSFFLLLALTYEDMTESIKINKTHGTAYFFRAQTYTDMSHFRLAADDYRSLLLIKPGHDVAYNNLAFVSNIIGNWEESILSATLSMELCAKYRKSSARSYAHRGYAHAKLGKLDQALEDCETSVRAEAEGYPRGYCHRAYVYFHLQRLEEALQDCNKAIEMGGMDMMDAYFVKGMVHKRQEKMELARSDFKYCKENKEFLKLFSLETVCGELKSCPSKVKFLCLF
jgi:tetratricopeptide (TPR) repeat protein